MKRLALLTVAAFMAVLMTACGERTDRKTDNAANAEQSQSQLDNAAKDADSKLQQQQGTTPTPDSNTQTQTGQ